MNTFLFFLAVGICIFIYLLILSRDLPSLEELEKFDPETVSKVYSADGVLLKQLFTHKRDVVTISKIPKHLRESLLVMEDRDFFEHSGFSFKGIARALFVDLITLSTRQGASTITQQLARNMYNIIGFEKTITRKLKEALTAIQIERTYTKSEILEMYLNSVYFGHGTYGVQAASKFYYGKNISEISMDEGALLVGMLPAPARYSPVNHPERAVSRRNLVITQLRKEGYLSSEDAESFSALPLAQKKHDIYEGIAPYFTEYVRRELEKKDEDLGVDLYQDGLIIYTTLDTRIQTSLDENFQNQMIKNQKILADELRNDPLRLKQIMELTKIEKDTILTFLESDSLIPVKYREQLLVEGAAVVLDTETGHILGMIGGRQEDEYQDHFNRATQAKRQPGSVFKPFIYMSALEQGHKPTTQLLNQPLVMFIDDTTQWNPQNHDGSTGLLTTLRDGLRRSLNLISVRIVQELIKPIDVKRNAKKFGLTTPIRAFDAIALGTSEVIPLEITSAYAAIANNGIYTKPVPITRIENRHGKVIWRSELEQKEVKDESNVYLIRDLMKSVVDRGTGGSIRWKYKFNSPAAGKTGTTDSKADAWFVGFTPQITMGVWVGMDDPAVSLGSKQFGSSAALPIWAKTMKDIYDTGNYYSDLKEITELEPNLNWIIPDGISELEICSETFDKPTQYCTRTKEKFLKQFQPRRTCRKHTSPFSRFGKD